MGAPRWWGRRSSSTYSRLDGRWRSRLQLSTRSVQLTTKSGEFILVRGTDLRVTLFELI
jgi:hypothetical protein